MTALVTQAAGRAGPSSPACVALLAGVASASSASGLVKVKMLPFDNKSEFQVLVDHDRGDAARGDARDRAADEPLPRHGARGDGRPDLRRHRRALQLQRPRAPLLPAPLALRGRPAGEPRRARTSATPRATTSPSACGRRSSRSRRGAARGSRWSRSRPGRRCSTRWWPRSTARRRGARGRWRSDGPRPLRDDAGRRGRRRLDGGGARARARERSTGRRPGSRASRPTAAVETLAGPGAGRDVGRLDAPAAREPVPVRVRLSAADRGEPRAPPLAARRLARGRRRSRSASSRASSATPEPQPLVHKDLKPVVYVFGDLAGERESPVYAIAALNEKLDALKLPGRRAGRALLDRARPRPPTARP